MFRLTLLAVMLLSVPIIAPAQTDLTTKTAFLETLTRELLQTDGQPLDLGRNMGYRGVVLLPPGTALPSTMTPFDALGTQTMNVSVMLENVSTFDRPLLVKDGTGHLSALSIADVWESVLRKTQPTAAQADDDTDTDSSPWLFRKTDEVDQIRGVRYLREPSAAMLRYREFESLYRVLTLAQQHDDGTWRLHPRLSQYGSIEEAKAALAGDWLTYGYKSEVETALTHILSDPATAAWRAWIEADARFTAGRRFVDQDIWVPQTLLFPPPSEWLGMGTWIRMTAPTSDPTVRVAFQIARIRILRPWLALDQLLGGQLTFTNSANTPAAAKLSDGAVPTVLSYPQGLMAVIPEELILVRNIRFMRGAEILPGLAAPDQHPLARFSYPDATNLVGYVVRSLPKLPK